MYKTFLFLLIISFSPAHAEIVVLTHGYLGSSQSWIQPGVSQQLQQAGYRDGGSYIAKDQKALLQTPEKWQGDKVYYTVNLPSMAPMNLQADWLAAYLHDISIRHPGTPVTLVGHSAGGVAARLMLVRNGKGNVSKLITIASPHLGTMRAMQALAATSKGGMFGWVRGIAVRRYTGDHIYNTLRASRQALNDLIPPREGNMLYWLNSQPHPDISYISVVRASDRMVPPISQDMRQIPELADRAVTHIVEPGHFLRPLDGELLLKLL